jgi:hypothetical protein
VPDDALLDILSTADVCVNPDVICELNNISTMIKIMEYMALGKPIVQFESKEGRFSAQSASLYAGGVDPVGEFTTKLFFLLDNPDERARMGRAGRERVQNELAWEYSVAHLLRAYERAFSKRKPSRDSAAGALTTSDSFYTLKPLIPRSVQILARRRMALRRARRCHDSWPISEASGGSPSGWPGWPDGKRFALVLTHDVESAVGVSNCERLADLEQQRGFRSTFGFVPLRYHTPERLRQTLLSRDFEVMVHDLYHDGRLYRNRKIFEERRPHIDDFLRQWQCRGFSSGSMLHNLPWIGDLDIDFDTSTYDVDPFEPQACGIGRIFPFWVQPPDRPGFVELPYTLPQDFTLFVLLREVTTAVWRRKLDWIVQNGGMALIKVHPDYMAFGPNDTRSDRYPAEFYTDFLDYLDSRYRGEFWLAHPSEVARYWRGLQQEQGANGISASKTFCSSCQRAHAAGWLSEYPLPNAGVPIVGPAGALQMRLGRF